MPILRPCFNWPLCDGKAYARHASDTTRLCRACWNVAPKRYGKVYLESSETPVPRTKVFHPKNRQTPAKPTIDQYLRDFSGAFDKEKERQQRIDAYWEKHPELTRVQVSRRMKK